MKKLVPALAGAVMLLGMTTATYATEWMDCSDPTDHVQMGVLLGGIDFAEQSRAHMRSARNGGPPTPPSNPAPGRCRSPTTSSTGRSSPSPSSMRSTWASSARCVSSSFPPTTATPKGGVLSIPGKGVWAVTCEGP